MQSILNDLFVHTAPNVPLTAWLFRYSVANGQRDLQARFCISRGHEGSVYLGICEMPTPPDADPSPFSAVIIWDVPNRQFRMRNRGADEQSVSAANGILGTPFKPILIDPSGPPDTHLGYTTYCVKGVNRLRYCPSLELAMIYEEKVANDEHEYVVQSVQRGEPDLRPFDIC